MSGEDLAERVTKAMYDDRPMTAISPALAELAGVPINDPITWERSIEIGADHSGLRRLARAAVAYLTALDAGTSTEIAAIVREPGGELLDKLLRIGDLVGVPRPPQHVSAIREGEDVA